MTHNCTNIVLPGGQCFLLLSSKCPLFVMKVADTDFHPRRCHPTPLSSQCLTLGWLCCIASYDGLKIKKIVNISSLLFWYL
ncbi:hypothetical protein [Wolbachia endosymbiont (group A) of Epirrhoe alternata]|uniref:hypothetical protein n=1 Tax=Wolbachia endosymbiont (group A) of Epirrhoe alternata TaxID=2954007 RepID=UPI002231B5CB|nr:hypothetical protein [Wolbachia endosymbiont (group A) of Epirrhoe alternata]